MDYGYIIYKHQPVTRLDNRSSDYTVVATIRWDCSCGYYGVNSPASYASHLAETLATAEADAATASRDAE